MGANGYKLGTLGALIGALFAILAFFVGFSSERVINQVNLIHSSGQGEHGYSSLTGTYRVADPAAAAVVVAAMTMMATAKVLMP